MGHKYMQQACFVKKLDKMVTKNGRPRDERPFSQFYFTKSLLNVCELGRIPVETAVTGDDPEGAEVIDGDGVTAVVRRRG